MSFAVFTRFFFSFLAILLMPLNPVFAQAENDSLLQELNLANGADRIEILNHLAENLLPDSVPVAMQYAREALTLSERYKNDQGLIDAKLIIGDGYYYQNDFAKARELYLEALEMSEKKNDRKRAAQALYDLALNYEGENDFENTEKYYLLALEYYRSVADYKMTMSLHYNLGDFYSKNGKNYEALDSFEKSVAISDSLGLDEESAETLNAIGVLYYEWGDFEKAIGYYKRSLRIMQENNNRSGIAQVVNNLGLLYYGLGNFAEALRYYEESLEFEKEMNNPLGIATSFNNIGIIYADKKQYEKALDYYEKSLSIGEELGNKSSIATALNNMGELYSNNGQSAMAIIMLERSLQLEKEIADKYGVATAYVTLSNLYLKTGNIGASLLYNDSSFKLAAEIHNPETLLSVYEIYYRISELQGKPKKALEYFKKLTSIKDSLFNKSLHEQLSEVQSKYELDQKEKEIELLASKNRLNQLDLENKLNIVERQRVILVLTFSGFIAILIVIIILFKQIKQKKKAYILLDEQNKQILKGREELILAKERAEESDRLKSVFLANMSHELRTPLNGILGFTEILRSEIENPVYAHMAEVIHTSGNRLLETLNSIIDLSIIESNRMEVESQEIPLHDIINERIVLFTANAARKNIGISAEVKNEDVTVFSDQKIITSLLNNLIENAIKYTEKGSVKVFAEIIEKQNTSWLQIKVSDTGIGIAEEKLINIFESFRQGSEGHDRQFEGAGLGLTICKKYVEILGGEIKVESKIGHGSVFMFAIPVKTASLSGAKIASVAKSLKINREKSGTTQKPEVLIVENDETNIAHLEYILHETCNTQTARNGKEAIELAALQHFQIILMDINLGINMNGMQAAQAIREIEGYQKTPIIAVTANAMKGHKEEFLANGCSHYISKPFSAAQIKKLIREVYEESY